MRKWILRLSAVAVLVVALVALDRTLFAPDPIPVRVFEVERGSVEATVTNSKAGTVKARRRAMLSPEFGGIVVEITHRKGDRVEAGEVLIRLQDATQRAQLLLAQRGLDASQALHAKACISSERAARELQRNQELARDAIVSADLLDRLESVHKLELANCQGTEAEVERSRASVIVAETELAKCEIRAPFAGIVADMAVEVGEWVTAAPPLMTVPGVVDLIDTASLYVSAPMDEVDSAVIRPGQKAKVTLDAFPDREFAGGVVRVAPFVLDLEAQNRTVEIEVELADRDLSEGLLPGTSADVEIVLETRGDVVRIPTSTLMEGGRVLVLDEGTLIERRVETGLRNWDWVEVVSGLEPAERIVRSLDRIEVKAGARVVVEPAADRS